MLDILFRASVVEGRERYSLGKEPHFLLSRLGNFVALSFVCEMSCAGTLTFIVRVMVEHDAPGAFGELIKRQRCSTDVSMSVRYLVPVDV